MSNAPNATALSLRTATAGDRFRVRRWLAEAEALAWWGDAASAEAEISLAMSSNVALCRIVEQGAAPIGYGHAVEIGLWAGPLPEGLAPGTWKIDLFIAASRQDGLVAQALALLVEEVFATTLAIACCGLVPISNEAAARAYERAQFRWRRIWKDPRLGPTWVMLRERAF